MTCFQVLNERPDQHLIVFAQVALGELYICLSSKLFVYCGGKSLHNVTTQW